MSVLLACLLVLLGLGAAERRARDAAWRAVPVRIHVNGTRGKSTVTRLIWAALLEAGVPTVAKTTGTAPRLLLPDGSERSLARRGPASFREPLALLRRARREGARAVVAECMALDPGLQWVSEREMIGASVGVITNARTDHTEVMGPSLQDVANSLANTIPPGGVLVAGDRRFADLLEQRAALAGARVVFAADPDPAASPGERWMREDERIALAATRQLGIGDDVAARGFARAPRDPGAATGGVARVARRPLRWIDATAANDPESLQALVEDLLAGPEGGVSLRPDLVVYNHRADRVPRLACFAGQSAVISGSARLVVTGDRPPWTVWRRLRRRQGTAPLFVPARRLSRWLQTGADDASVLVFCGNTRGLDVARTMAEVSRG